MIVVCPKCDIALILMEFHGVEVDYCPRCEGVWLDHGEIELLLERTGGVGADPFQDFLEAEVRPETGRAAYLCPRCDRALMEVARRGADGEELRLDRCPRNDGVWFDKNELLMLLKSLPASMSATGAIALLSDVLGCYTVEAPATCSIANENRKGDSIG